MASELISKRPVGRPSKLTPLVIKKLEEAFAMGSSDGEACYYAEISTVTFYAYLKKNPEFVNRRDQLKERPVLMARQKVVNEITSDVKVAQWFLERKRKGEFAVRTDITSGDEPLQFSVVRNIEKQDVVEGEIVE